MEVLPLIGPLVALVPLVKAMLGAPPQIPASAPLEEGEEARPLRAARPPVALLAGEAQHTHGRSTMGAMVVEEAGASLQVRQLVAARMQETAPRGARLRVEAMGPPISEEGVEGREMEGLVSREETGARVSS